MDSSRQTNGGNFWALLLGAGAVSLLLAGLASLWTTQLKGRQRESLTDRARQLGAAVGSRAGVRGDVRRAGRAATRGLGGGLGAAWDVTVGGADVARTATNVGPAITGSVREVQISLASASQRMSHAVFSFIIGTLWTILWLSIAGTVLMFIYLPESGQRERFLARVRQAYDQVRHTIG